jgi:hypothetical protein
VPGGVHVAEEGTIMISPIRQRALVRELRKNLDRLEEIGRPHPHESSHPTPQLITPPYIPIPLIASVPAMKVEIELIPTTRLSLTNTKDTGDIDMTITQEDKQPNEQVEDDDLEEVQRIKKLVQDKLIKHWNDHNQKLPQSIRISAHNLLPLASSGLIETVFKLRDTNIIIVADPKAGDDIQCDI